MGLRALPLILFVGSTWACDRDEAPAPPAPDAEEQPTTVESVLMPTPEPSGSTTAEDPAPAIITTWSGPSDSVSLEEGPGIGRYLVWSTRRDGAWERYWTSLDVYGAYPDVTLADFDEDGTTDIFWSMAWEELAGAAFDFHRPDSAEHVYVPGVHCEEPRLLRESDGYRVEVSSPGVEPACREMGVGEECVAADARFWPRLFALEGTELVEVFAAAEVYEERATRYLDAASRFDSVWASDATYPGSGVAFSTICPQEYSTRLRVMADSAAALAGASDP